MSTDPIPVRIAEGSVSGLAHILQQYLAQDMAEFESKRAHASKLRGRVAMSASDKDATVTLDFRGTEILISDGDTGPVDASIGGPYDQLLGVIRGDTNPLVAHLKRRLRVRARPRRILLPLQLHRLLKLEPEARHA